MFFGVSLATAGSCIYILGPEAVLCRDHNPKPTWFLIRTKLVCQDIKNKTAKGSCAPARRRTGFRRTIHAHVACTPRLVSPRPGPARRGEASERARVVFPFSSHTSLRVVERTHYIKRSNSSSTSKVGLNLAPPLAILHMGFEISEIAMGLAH